MAAASTTCPDEERRKLLNLLLEEATIDGENKVTLTLAIPPDDEADEGVVITAYELAGRPLGAYRRRMRRRSG